MSHPNPNQADMDSANKTASLAIPGIAKYNWMIIANNMANHPIRSCGHIRKYANVLGPEQNKRTNALNVFAAHTNQTPFRDYFPTANIPADLPTTANILDLGHVWFENACQLAEKTQANVTSAHRHITEAVRLRTGDPNAVMVAKDFLAARELAILEDGMAQGLAQGRAEGLAQGKAEGRKEAFQEMGMEDDSIDLTDD